MVAFGHQPSASTQTMVAAGEACRAIKAVAPGQPLLIVGGHPSALPERTLAEEAVDFVCKGEGPVTVVQLVGALKAASAPGPDLAAIEGLVWRREPGGDAVINPAAPLITDLDADLHGIVWDLLPMASYRAHNWQCFGDLAARQPYASIYTSLGCPYRCSFCCINAPFGANRYRMRAPSPRRRRGRPPLPQLRREDIQDRRRDVRAERAPCAGDLRRTDRSRLSDRLNFWAYARVDTVKPALLATLRAGGLPLAGPWHRIRLRPRARRRAKRLNQKEIVEVVRQIQDAGVAVIGNYIFGLPDDTEQPCGRRWTWRSELNCEFANFYSAMAYPGSRLHSLAERNGWPLPESWSGYAQHSYECLPLATRTLTAAEVLRFRDQAFHDYFADPRYLEMIDWRFGAETRAHVELMAGHRLRRRLLDEPAEQPLPATA